MAIAQIADYIISTSVGMCDPSKALLVGATLADELQARSS